MPFVTSVHASLPYVDTEPTTTQRAHAQALIDDECGRVKDDPNHALLRPLHKSWLTPAMRSEVDRVAANQKLSKKDRTPLAVIDLTRYETQEAGAPESTTNVDLHNTLPQVYTSQSYLHTRRIHLALLDSYGKNSWLVGNWQAESELRSAERDLAQLRRDIDIITLQRQAAQNDISAELHGLEDAWRTGLGRVLEAEAAVADLKQHILEVRREQAEGDS